MRLRYSHQIGCDSADGTQWVRWRRRRLRWGLEYLAALDRHAAQLELGIEAAASGPPLVHQRP
jgi:hypothetical protein